MCVLNFRYKLTNLYDTAAKASNCIIAVIKKIISPLEEEGSTENCIRAFVTGPKKEISKSFLRSTQATSTLRIATLRPGLMLSLWTETRGGVNDHIKTLKLHPLALYKHEKCEILKTWKGWVCFQTNLFVEGPYIKISKGEQCTVLGLTSLARVISLSLLARDSTRCERHKAARGYHRRRPVPKLCSRWRCGPLAESLQAAASQWSDHSPAR